jgi:1-deoxy-D-xylulose-5-phosphate reductoisomerase
LKGLTFEEPDREKFPCLQLAFDAIGRGGNIPCALNAANEAAVAAYLQDRIAFYEIPDAIASAMDGVDFVANPSLDDIFATHEAAYRLAEQRFFRV